MNRARLADKLKDAERSFNSGHLQESENICNDLLKEDQNHSEALYILGAIAHRQGCCDKAVSYFNRAIGVNSSNSRYYLGLGIVQNQQGKFEAAIRSFKKSLKINPDIFNTQYNLGTVFLRLNRFDSASRCFRKAVQLNPNSVSALNNLGLSLINLGSFDEAETWFKKSITIKPDFMGAYINLGMMLTRQGKLTEAVYHLKKATALDSNHPQAQHALAVALLNQARVDEAMIWFKKSLQEKPDAAVTHSDFLFGMHYQDRIDPIALFLHHLLWASQHAAPSNKYQLFTNDRSSHRRLRIGYLSPDFRDHSVAHFIEPIIASHNRLTFEIFCYSNVQNPDAITEHLKGISDTWKDISSLSDEKAAEMIRADGIDILVDLAGHTANNRLLVFANRPAPIQVAYLGYPDTTGLPAIQYRLTDAWADPPGRSDLLSSEEPVRLPKGFHCYVPLLETPPVNALPAIENGHITFGSFNNGRKITHTTISLWAEILSLVPDSKMVIKSKALTDPETAAGLQKRFRENGISPDKIRLAGRTESKYKHLDLYNDIDIALDTYPYNGTTTTLEALWMGVPVITLAGETHISRVGKSLLSHLNLADLIAESSENYINFAVSLAGDIERLKTLRAGLRNRLTASPLMDSARFTQSLEAVYRKMWQQWSLSEKTGRFFNNDEPSANDSVARIDPSPQEDAVSLNEKGEMFFHSGNCNEARSRFLQAVESDPTYILPYNNLGVLSWHTGDVGTSVDYFKKSFFLKQDHPDLIANLKDIISRLESADI